MSTNNFFNKMNKWADGSFAVMPFIGLVAMFVIGCIFFWEDTMSSLEGIQQFQTHFDLRMVTWEGTYWAVALTPQVAQVVFFYIFLTDTKNHKIFLVFAFIAVVIDLFLDGLYRSGGYLGSVERTGAVAIATFVYSMLSEAFISFSAGYLLVMASPLWKKTNENIVRPLAGSVPKRERRSVRARQRRTASTPAAQSQPYVEDYSDLMEQ